MATCEKHGEYEEREYQFCGKTLKAMCPQCDSEITAEHEKQEQEQERLAKERRELERLRFANIEPAYSKASFANFIADTLELQHNLSRLNDLTAGTINKIVMTGKNGTGKTHLACAAINLMGGKIMTMYEISTTIRASYSRNEGETELQIVDGYARLPLFVIDEIGRTKGSDTEANWLSYVIDKRHVRGLPTILISNKHTRKTCAKEGCADCLENYIAEDVMSRLCENGVLLRFSGDDYRRKEGRHGEA